MTDNAYYEHGMSPLVAEGIRFSVDPIPGGLAGIDETVSRIGNLVGRSLEGQRVRLLTLNVLRLGAVPNHRNLAAARAVFRWVRSHIRYILDPPNLETIQAPEVTLKLGAGDCDDHSALVAAMLLSIGLPVRFRVTGPSPERLSHIYPETLIDGRWWPMDTTRSSRFGAKVPSLGVERIYTWRGEVAMPYVGLGANESTGTRAVNIDRSQLEAVAYRGALKALKNNWEAGLINRADLLSYLRVIDEGNAPGRGTFAEKPMRRAVADFLAHVDKRGLLSRKTPGFNNGMEGLEGFLGSVWKGVKKAVGFVGKVVGGGGAQVTVQPQVNIPAITTQVTPETGRAAVADILKSPVTWLIGGGIILALLLPALRRR